jgi:hypothetical protein
VLLKEVVDDVSDGATLKHGLRGNRDPDPPRDADRQLVISRFLCHGSHCHTAARDACPPRSRHQTSDDLVARDDHVLG